MYVVNGLLDFIENFFSSISRLYYWLNTPFLTIENMPLSFLLLGRLGVDIEWMYGLTPLVLISTSLATFLGVFLLIKFIGAILDAIPIFGG